ncbi:hypothetical protein R76696_04499 [Ralstonia mannitolilytica]|nr:hypothetical protein R76696_04499 [Ralstonia mannitolilytica]
MSDDFPVTAAWSVPSSNASLLVPARVLIALLLAGSAEVLQRLVRVLQLVFQRTPEILMLGQPCGEVLGLLRQALGLDGSLLQGGLRVAVRCPHVGEGGMRLGQLGARLRKLRVGRDS